MCASQTQLTIAAQNLAGATSDGFHRILVHERLTTRGITVVRERDNAPGALRATGRPLDLALAGTGSLYLRDGTPTRGGALERRPSGTLAFAGGRELAGMHGAARFPLGANIAPDGAIRLDGKVVDHLRVDPGTRLASGFLEAADTDSADAMIAVLDAQRSFETAQKCESGIDAVDQRDASEIARPGQ